MSVLLQEEPPISELRKSRIEYLAGEALKGLQRGGGNVLLLAGLQNGELLECLRKACGPDVVIIVAVESTKALTRWLTMHGKLVGGASDNTELYLYGQPEQIIEKWAALLLGMSSKPVIVSLFPHQEVERLFAPLTAQILELQYRRTDWQQKHMRSTRDILNGLCDANGVFQRVDIVVRCLAIEHFLTKGTLGPLYPKMQSVRRNMRVDGMPCRVLCEQFKRLIISYMHKGYDLSKPITMEPGGHLVDGAHRLACAKYFNTRQLTVVEGRSLKKRPFDMFWFEQHFSAEEVALLRRSCSENSGRDFHTMSALCR